MRGDVEEEGEEEDKKSVDAALQWGEDEVFIRDLTAMVLEVLLGFERRDARN